VRIENLAKNTTQADIENALWEMLIEEESKNIASEE